MGRAVRPAVRATWRRPTWLTVSKQRPPSSSSSFFFIIICSAHVLCCTSFSPVCVFTQESKRVCAGHPLRRSTPTRPASTRRCAHASRTCLRYQVTAVCSWRLCVRTIASPSSTPAFNTDGYFNEDAKYNLCYCESCHKLRGDEAYYKRGEPPRDYALPFGWCRFALRWV